MCLHRLWLRIYRGCSCLSCFLFRYFSGLLLSDLLEQIWILSNVSSVYEMVLELRRTHLSPTSG